MTSDAGENGLTFTRLISQWWVVIGIALIIQWMTGNPLLTLVLPYVRAALPALRTGLWLKQVDPWPARGTVGLLIHLGLAGFLAGATGLVSVVAFVVIEDARRQNGGPAPPMTQAVIGLVTILLGATIASLMLIAAIRIAWVHKIRIYAQANLAEATGGDFANAARQDGHSSGFNPAFYVLCVGVTLPMFVLWTAALIVIPAWIPQANDLALQILQFGVPVVAFVCLMSVWRLSHRILARSPEECWGGIPPEASRISPVVTENWYADS